MLTPQVPRAAPDAVAAEPAPAPAGSALRILVIDDEQSVRETLVDLLTEDGHSVIAAASGAEGLARLADGAGVDVVVTDLGMPAMTGWDVVQAVRARHPGLAIGLITGWAAALEISEEERRAVDFVLAKPYTAEALRASLAAVHPRG